MIVKKKKSAGEGSTRDKKVRLSKVEPAFVGISKLEPRYI